MNFTILRKCSCGDAPDAHNDNNNNNNNNNSNNNNNNNNNDDDVEGAEYPITLRANYNKMKCEIRCAYRINFGKPKSIRSLLRFSSKRIL